MNTRVVGILVALFVLLGIGGFYILGKNESKKTAVSTTPSKTSTIAPKQNLAQILALGKNQKCDFSYTSEDKITTQGSVYLSKDKMRADFTNKKAQKTSDFHVIRAGNTYYVWGTDFQTGIKMNLEGSVMQSQLNKYLDTNQDINYKCSPWLVENLKFVQPSNVKFTDYSSVTLPKTGVGASCGACNYLSGEDKTACLKQLNCPLAE